VDFVDIDPDTCNMSVAHLERKLIRAEQEGKLPKIVIPVHFAGNPAAMEQIAMRANGTALPLSKMLPMQSEVRISSRRSVRVHFPI